MTIKGKLILIFSLFISFLTLGVLLNLYLVDNLESDQKEFIDDL